MRAAAALLAVLLAGCVAPRAAGVETYAPDPGTNLVLEGPIAAAPGHHLVVGDILAPAGTIIPRHTHSGEEFLYIIGGSATVSREGQPDVMLGPGESLRIAPGLVHGGVAGPEGVRAVSSWVVVDGQPLRTPVD